MELQIGTSEWEVDVHRSQDRSDLSSDSEILGDTIIPELIRTQRRWD